ncbi:MAG: cache domain-containing protein, partial [Planctomycetota bacterium]
MMSDGGQPRARIAWPQGKLLALLVAVGVAVFFSHWVIHRSDRGLRDHLAAQVRLVAGALDIQDLQALSGTEADLGRPEYLHLKGELARSKLAHDKCRFVYLLGRLPDGAVFFFADNEPVGAEHESPAGQIYQEASPDCLRAFDARCGLVEGPLTDRWGTWVTALAPLTDPETGDLIAMLGMDIDAATWKWEVAADAVLPLGMMLALLIALASYLLASRPEVNVSPRPVQRRLLIPLMGTMLLLIGGFWSTLLYVKSENLDQHSREQLSAARLAVVEAIAQQSWKLSALENVLLRDERLIDALKVQDRDRLLADYQPLFEQLREEHAVTHFYFHRPDRVNLLRVHDPGRSGDLIDRFTALEAERTGKTAMGIELGPLGTFTLRAVRPIFADHELIGYLELGKEIEDILVHVQDTHGVSLAASIYKAALTRRGWEVGMKMLGREDSWSRFPEKVIIFSSFPRFPDEAERFVRENGHEHLEKTAEAEFGGRSWRVQVIPLLYASGSEVGDLILFWDATSAILQFDRLLMVGSGTALVLLAALFGFLFVALRRTDRSILAQRAELQAGRDRLNQLAEHSGTVAWEVDADGLFTYVN